MGCKEHNDVAALFYRRLFGEMLSTTIASSGIERAAARYFELKAAQPAVYNFDERELNDLGYTLMRAGTFKDAIRIFQLNVDAFPQSSNTYDSLGEAYMNDGDESLAVTNYQESLVLNPKNANAVRMLQNLNAR